MTCDEFRTFNAGEFEEFANRTTTAERAACAGHFYKCKDCRRWPADTKPRGATTEQVRFVDDLLVHDRADGEAMATAKRAYNGIGTNEQVELLAEILLRRVEGEPNDLQ